MLLDIVRQIVNKNEELVNYKEATAQRLHTEEGHTEPEMVFVQGVTFEVCTGFLARRVTLSDYYIGKYPVTQRLWKPVMAGTPIADPSVFKGDDLPVDNVSWNDIVNEFLPRLNAMTGKTYRLPTEAEWEYAARGGNKSCGYKYSGGNTIDDVAWYGDNSDGKTHAAGTKSPNELEIYDMSGNVYEWVNDWRGDYSSVAQTNPKGPSSGYFRMMRGGAWNSVAVGGHVSLRYCHYPDGRSDDIGFRLAVSPM
jgi:formylglycine-generating enzyme required for sulfatase activity